MTRGKEFLLRIADIGFLVSWRCPDPRMPQNSCYRGFIFQESAVAGALEGLRHLVRVRVSWNKPPGEMESKPFKLLPDFWKLYRVKGGYRMECFHPRRKKLLSVSFIGADFKDVRYYPCVLDEALCRDYGVSEGRDTWLPDLLIHPPLRYLLVNILSRYSGCMGHGCVVSTKRGGYAFMGESGSGKTTLAGILRKDPELSVLTDESFVLRKEEDDYLVYGTPWPGGGRIASPNGARLAGICFISHGKRNLLKKISPRASRNKFMAQCIIGAVEMPLLEANLKFVQSVVQDIPCYELGFVNNESIGAFLKKKLI